ncbi:MAG: response regulator [Desulfobacteraceae bacterium]|nr:response regulator [Desulfobacteraceae bacterium]
MTFSILLVDDSLPMRSVLKKTLKAAGYSDSEFHEAANGKEALDLVKGKWIDIVITDYNMPVMDGMEFIRELKKDDTFKETPVVIVSTEGSKSKIDEFKAQGATGYITKPFTPETIRETIIEILGETNDEESYGSDEDLDF